MCPNLIKLEYNVKTCRYDEKTNKLLSYFLRYGIVQGKFENYVESNVNICYRNTTRIMMRGTIWKRNRNEI